MKTKHLIKGVLKSIPGIEKFYNFHTHTGGSNNARYCYSIWMRHLVMAHEHGLTCIPKDVAELGPGDSLGIGLSALLSGAERYTALDIVHYTDAKRNLEIFEDLIALFKNKTAIPSEKEFPNVRPSLKSYKFPEHILSDEHLKNVLDPARLQLIRNSIQLIDEPNGKKSGNMINYRVPWNDDKEIESESIDMIISQAVLQHVDSLGLTYECMHKWLKKGGFMSHGIDFKSMGSADTWDGHWAYTDLEWKIVRGRKSYLINREPISTHMKLLQDNEFRVVCNLKSINESNRVKKKDLAPRFRKLSMEDLSVSGVFIQAVKNVFASMAIFCGEFIEVFQVA